MPNKFVDVTPAKGPNFGKITFGEIRTEGAERDHEGIFELMYRQAWNEIGAPYGLVIGYRVSEWIEEGRTRVCEVEPIDDPGNKAFLMDQLRDKLEGPIIFFA